MGQVELGELCGVTQATISNIERGLHDPHTSTLQKLASVLNVPVAAFFQEYTDPDGGGGGKPSEPEGVQITTAHIMAAKPEHDELNAALEAGHISQELYSRRVTDLYERVDAELRRAAQGEVG